MLQSHLFTKTRREAPKDEVSKNAQLLIRAGFIHKEMAGVYSYLPLGLRVLNKIQGIIREEMNAVGGQEMLLTALQSKEPWEKTGRWDDKAVDNWFKTELKNGTQVGLALTHEDPLTALMIDYVKSYRDLPIYAYQFQTKFRNEARAKSGIMRGREFLMKDLYSFSASEAEHQKFYDQMKKSYLNVYSRVGLGDITYLTLASGGIFSKVSHEFQTLTEAGEDHIHICDKCKMAINEEVIADQKACPECGNAELRKAKAVEVGNIFPLGTRFSDALGLKFADESGVEKSAVMGSYGIGLGRVMGVIVEALSDDKGIVWPKSVAPFAAHLVLMSPEDPAAKKYADELYQKLVGQSIEVLYDDRILRAGEKFADSDLIGIPWRIVVGKKSLEKGEIEVKGRKEEAPRFVSEQELFKIIS